MDHEQVAPRKPFRFLDLPLEVRNEIYNVILCTPPPPKLWPLEQQDLVGVPHHNCYIHHPLETQMLRVNRQIHAEARDAMLRGNQFIRIRERHASDTAESIVQKVTRWRQIPILATTAHFRANFKGFVMTHLMEGLETGKESDAAQALREHRDGDVDCVILRRDLDVFLETLAFIGIATQKSFDSSTRHYVQVHNPFDDTLSPGFMGEMNQERLLQPYCDHLREFTSVTILGHVSPIVVDTVQKSIAKELFDNPSEALEAVQTAKDLGNTFFRQREFHKAAAAYWIARSKAASIQGRSSWAKAKAHCGAGFVQALAEMHFQVCLNAAQNILTWIRETPAAAAGGARARDAALQADAYAAQAERSPMLFETAWRPTLAQMAKANFRHAAAQRALMDLQAAKRYIDSARIQAPADQIIKREAEEIEAEARAQAGLGRLLL